jgi:Tfp pilus assembly protein PilF
MSRTLNVCNHLLDQGRKYQQIGIEHRAQRVLGHLARLAELPADVAEECQVRLAQLLLKAHKFARARRILTAALSHDDNNGAYHHLMAQAVAADRRETRDRALEHYRRCVELAQDEPHFHADAGAFAARHGHGQLGLQWLRRAVELAPEDVEVVGKVVRGLQAAGQVDEARQMARAALFRNSSDPRFRQLWNDFRFRELYRRQQRAQKRRLIRGAIAEGRVFLSFEEMTIETANGRRVVRQDRPSRTPGPNFLRLPRGVERKHA